MFDADRPIISSRQDRLNRAVFSKYLARSILDHKDPDSLVIGLNGSWGSGKTSIINLVLEELNFALTNLEDNEKPIILNFNPWNYSGSQQLMYYFFLRLSHAFDVDFLEDRSNIIYLLNSYASYFTHKPLVYKKNDERTLWEKITKFNISEKTGISNKNYRDPAFIKAELNELLLNQQHKIIIIMDNISRLYPFEIKQIFQIIKSISNFVNTSYLLALDKNQVIHAIDRIDGVGGAEFLEKIVQLPFEVPPILQQDLERIFSDRMINIVKSVPQDAFSSEYWADIYNSSLKYFFENCRDITRYTNTLNFSYPRLRDVVNPVDFFALTVLEVFIPDVYFGIRENKDLFSDLLDHVYALDEDQIEKEKIRCDEILARNKRISYDILLQLLIRLFPRIRKVYFPNEMFYHSDALAEKLKRVCSPDLFDVYFRLSMQTGQVTPSEFHTILSLADDEPAFDQALTGLNQDDRMTKFLDLLDSSHIINAIPNHHIQTIVDALLENGDLIPEGLVDELSLDTPTRIHRIIHGLLRKMPTSEERFIILQNAIAKASKSIYIIVRELEEQSREHALETDTFQPLEFRDLLPEELDNLCKLAVSRIEEWAHNGSLIDHPKLIPILFAWRDWSDNENCRRYVAEITKTDRGLVAFLCAALRKPISEAMTEYVQTPEWEKSLDNINAFIPANLLEEHARTLFEDEYFEKLREREQLALMIFLDLLKTPTQKLVRKTSA